MNIVDQILEGFGNRIMRRYGYIQMDGQKLDQFYIYPKYRGLGLARKLSKLIPKNCWLIAYPIRQGGEGLEEQQLINFYQSLGFKIIDLGKNRIGNVMVRGTVDLSQVKSQTTIP